MGDVLPESSPRAGLAAGAAGVADVFDFPGVFLGVLLCDRLLRRLGVPVLLGIVSVSSGS